ncbi:MAG: lysozyme inhibitor LprI family protein [Pseudomonadota bacterium]
MRIFLIWAPVVMLLTFIEARAQAVDDCQDSSLATSAVTECLQEAMKKSAEVLTNTIHDARQAARKLDQAANNEQSFQALYVANAAFSVYRDAACRSVGAFSGPGAGAGDAISRCYIALNQARTQLIRQSAGLDNTTD